MARIVINTKKRQRHPKKKTLRYKSKATRVPRLIALRPHQFTKTMHYSEDVWGTWQNLLGMNGLANGYMAKDFTFNFSAISGYAEFLVMFERYRLDEIIFKISCANTVTSGDVDMNAGSVDVAQLMLVTLPSEDTNRVSVKKNLRDVQEMSKPRIRALINPTSKPIVVRFKPNILIQTYETGALTGYTARRSPYLFTEEYTHLHYGLSLGLFRADGASMDPATGPELPHINYSITYNFTCKTTA